MLNCPGGISQSQLTYLRLMPIRQRLELGASPFRSIQLAFEEEET